MVTLDDLFNCSGIIHCSEITQPFQVPLHHFTQDPAHYLTRARLWQMLDELKQ